MLLEHSNKNIDEAKRKGTKAGEKGVYRWQKSVTKQKSTANNWTGF
jgi:hypothetical protein